MYSDTGICQKEPQKCKKFARSALDNALIMKDIVDDILDVQKMEAGEMSFNFAEREMVSIVQNTLDMVSQYASKHNVKLNLVSDENIIYCKVDERRIKQALTNLLSNAIKYSPENETVVVTIWKQASSVMISVSDRGPGIDKDFQGQIFNKFSQSKSKLTRMIGGTGLGLALVKHIVAAHKGAVTFDTDPEKGTTFKINLLC